MSPRKCAVFTHHPIIMNNKIQAAFAVILAIGLSSCAVSYPYCDAYNSVDTVECQSIDVLSHDDCVDIAD